MAQTDTAPPAAARPLGRREFVALVAFVMALNSAAIDIYIPGLSDIAGAFDISSNARQFVITAYLIGFGVAQIAYGPLADAFGRRRILIIGLCIYLAASIGAIFATSFGMLLALRLIQGVGTAATRVVAVALIRDRFQGAAMANVMSLVMMVFMIMPVLAPNLGAVVLVFAGWRGLGAAMALVGAIALVWCWLRLHETLPVSERRPLTGHRLVEAFSIVLTDRVAATYTAASATMFGVLFAFVNQAEQILTETYHLGRNFTLVFAVVAGFLALSSFTNSRLVQRLGTRRLSHSALVAHFALSLVHLALVVAWGGVTPFWLFILLLGLSLGLFGFTPPNFNAIAMQPMGHVAGVASAVVGSAQTIGGAVFGGLIGYFYDGSLYALIVGSTVLSGVTLAIVLYAERGRLFTNPREQ